MEKSLGHYTLTYLPEHTIRKYDSTFSTSSYVREADMSPADRKDTTLSGPKMGQCRRRPDIWRPTRHLGPKIANTNIRHAQLSLAAVLSDGWGFCSPNFRPQVAQADGK